MFVPFRAVHLTEGELKTIEDADPGFSDRLRHVLDFYAVPWRAGDDDELLVPSEVAKDLDTAWNYTTKANDPDWLREH
jgi:hypothetical protein